jgi:hypothetical protein
MARSTVGVTSSSLSIMPLVIGVPQLQSIAPD